MSDTDTILLNVRMLETCFKRIVDKKRVCEVLKLQEGTWEVKDAFRCRNAFYEQNGNKFVISRLDETKRFVLSDWEALFDGTDNVLCMKKGSWKFVCKLDPADVKWIRMRLR